MIGHSIALAQVLEEGRHFGFKPLGQDLVGDILVLLVLTRNQVERALTMAGINPDHGREGINLHLGEKRPALGQLTTKERGIGIFRIDCLTPPSSPTKTHQDHVRAAIGPLLINAKRLLRQHCAPRNQQAGTGGDLPQKLATRYG